jgi:hypothetical protein
MSANISPPSNPEKTMAKGNPFAGKKAPAFGGKGKAPPFGKGPSKGGRGMTPPDPDAAQDAMGFRRGGKAKRK